MKTTDLGNGYFFNQNDDGSATMRNCDKGLRIDLPKESVDRLTNIIRSQNEPFKVMLEEGEKITQIFKEKDTRTRVCFRISTDRHFKGDVTALFVDQHEGSYIGCYAHVGQHSTCSAAWVTQCTKPAKPSEYADLKRELESEPFGYRFDVLSRFTRGKKQ